MFGQRLPQIGAALFDLDEPAAGEMRPQPAHDGLDFGKFGHERR
jgi:hypothetical protein